MSLQNATTFGDMTFSGCTHLTTMTLPAAETFGDGTFYYCLYLEEVDLQAATTFGNETFYACQSLATVTLPEAKTFGNDTFRVCSSLTTVTLDKAEEFGDETFSDCYRFATVILGANPPTVGDSTLHAKDLGLDEIPPVTNLTIKVPSGSTGAYNTPWQNAFQGAGTSGTGTINTDITLTITPLP